MPTSGKWWYHVIILTKGSWLPGDPRGFRSRDHRIHSSGDYRSPPPEGEHSGLYRHSKRLCPRAIQIPIEATPTAGLAIVSELDKQDHRLLALSVGSFHVHMLAELPLHERQRSDVIGDCKRLASHALRDCLPGVLWVRKGLAKAIRSRAHHRRVYTYVLKHQSVGAWVWSFRDGVVFDPRTSRKK